MSEISASSSGLIQPCPSCGKRNRIPYTRIAETGKCGACSAALPPPADPVDVKDAAAFDALIAQCPLPILVDIWAPWCGPCRATAPELAKAASMTTGRALVCKVNSDDQPALCARLGVRGIPDFRVFNQGRETGRQVGGIRCAELIRLLNLPA